MPINRIENLRSFGFYKKPKLLNFKLEFLKECNLYLLILMLTFPGTCVGLQRSKSTKTRTKSNKSQRRIILISQFSQRELMKAKRRLGFVMNLGAGYRYIY